MLSYTSITPLKSLLLPQAKALPLQISLFKATFLNLQALNDLEIPLFSLLIHPAFSLYSEMSNTSVPYHVFPLSVSSFSGFSTMSLADPALIK